LSKRVVIQYSAVPGYMEGEPATFHTEIQSPTEDESENHPGGWLHIETTTAGPIVLCFTSLADTFSAAANKLDSMGEMIGTRSEEGDYEPLIQDEADRLRGIMEKVYHHLCENDPNEAAELLLEEIDESGNDD